MSGEPSVFGFPNHEKVQKKRKSASGNGSPVRFRKIYLCVIGRNENGRVNNFLRNLAGSAVNALDDGEILVIAQAGTDGGLLEIVHHEIETIHRLYLFRSSKNQRCKWANFARTKKEEEEFFIYFALPPFPAHSRYGFMRINLL